jgi:nucleoside-diphosphate-sugar epimerase
VIYGDGLQTRDFVYVADVVRANLAACESPQAAGQVLNVASGRRTSLLQLVDALNAVLGTQFTPEFKAERQGDIRHSCGDGSLAAELLRPGAATSLTEGLRQGLA